MTSSSIRLRQLTPIELAFTRTNRHFGLNVTIVLQMATNLNVDRIKQALNILYKRHAIFHLAIVPNNSGYQFSRIKKEQEIPLHLVKKNSKDTWRREARKWLNTKLQLEDPLVQVEYLPYKFGTCELLFVFHHALVDSVFIRHILHDFLSICGGITIPQPFYRQDAFRNQPYPFPKSGYDLVYYKRMTSFIGKQCLEECRALLNGSQQPIPNDSTNEIIDIQFSLENSRKIMTSIARKGLSLNSILGSAILISVIKHLHQESFGKYYQAIVFADLRPYLNMQMDSYSFGSFISMLRYTLKIQDESVEGTARKLKQKIMQSARKKELLLYAMLSDKLLNLAIKTRKRRLGNSALSFMGKLDLNQDYGPIRLENVFGYITNNELGPEFSGLGKILFGRIELNFTYLASEMNHNQARSIVASIEKYLMNLIT